VLAPTFTRSPATAPYRSVTNDRCRKRACKAPSLRATSLLKAEGRSAAGGMPSEVRRRGHGFAKPGDMSTRTRTCHSASMSANQITTRSKGGPERYFTLMGRPALLV
jgi:hypothetical protein